MAHWGWVSGSTLYPLVIKDLDWRGPMLAAELRPLAGKLTGVPFPRSFPRARAAPLIPVCTAVLLHH